MKSQERQQFWQQHVTCLESRIVFLADVIVR